MRTATMSLATSGAMTPSGGRTGSVGATLIRPKRIRVSVEQMERTNLIQATEDDVPTSADRVGDRRHGHGEVDCAARAWHNAAIGGDGLLGIGGQVRPEFAKQTAGVKYGQKIKGCFTFWIGAWSLSC